MVKYLITSHFLQSVEVDDQNYLLFTSSIDITKLCLRLEEADCYKYLLLLYISQYSILH